VIRGDSDLPWATPEEIDVEVDFLKRVNKAGFLGDEDYEHLVALRDKHYIDSRGERHALLSDREFEALAVRKGNLTPEERQTINSHTEATRRILSKIPWTHDLEGIPEIAAHHHERPDGSGYPDGLHEEQISLESKILAVSDIYEALVAQDRPYKPAMPPERAISILQAEAAANHLDKDIVAFFVDKGIFRIFLDQLPISANAPS
jgi:hypothetical protein